MFDEIANLASAPRPLNRSGLGAFPLSDGLRHVLDQCRETPVAPTGIGRERYLDLAEQIVRAAAHWRVPGGAVIDPVEGLEAGQTSPRFVAPGAILLHFGRCPDLREEVCETMDYCCRRLAAGEAESPDFWMRELMTAFGCLQPLAPPERLAGWARDLAAVVPERIYHKVDPSGQNLAKLRNWTVYAAAGEVMRQRAGLAPPTEGAVWGDAFFDKYLPAQLAHFTEWGMYRDPADPITYDITTRLQIAVALGVGYRGPLRDEFGELLRRGALTQLFYLSPDGYVPYGGRSSQFQFQEAMTAAVCEFEARRYAAAGDPLAGVFKRQARLSTLAVARWFAMAPFRHLKNGFAPDDEFGIDGYGRYSVYSLLAASFWGLAALFADDDIPERAVPAELGGYTLELAPAFHKVFGATREAQLEIDTRADRHHDATGLGRFTCRGVPLELGPGMPCAAEPHYRLPEPYAGAGLALGPEWCLGGHWTRLAHLSEGLEPTLTVHRETPATVEVALTWRLTDGVVVHEALRLTNGRLHYAVHVDAPEPVTAVRVLVPLLHTDGDAESRISTESGRVRVTYRGAELAVTFAPELAAEVSETLRANRHGLYRTLTIEARGAEARAELALNTLETSPPQPRETS